MTKDQKKEKVKRVKAKYLSFRNSKLLALKKQKEEAKALFKELISE